MTWVKFEYAPLAGRDGHRCWRVIANADPHGPPVGEIRWYRKGYVLYPAPLTTWTPGALAEVEHFLLTNGAVLRTVRG